MITGRLLEWSLRNGHDVDVSAEDRGREIIGLCSILFLIALLALCLSACLLQVEYVIVLYSAIIQIISKNDEDFSQSDHKSEKRSQFRRSKNWKPVGPISGFAGTIQISARSIFRLPGYSGMRLYVLCICASSLLLTFRPSLPTYCLSRL